MRSKSLQQPTINHYLGTISPIKIISSPSSFGSCSPITRCSSSNHAAQFAPRRRINCRNIRFALLPYLRISFEGLNYPNVYDLRLPLNRHAALWTFGCCALSQTRLSSWHCRSRGKPQNLHRTNLEISPVTWAYAESREICSHSPYTHRT